MYNIFVHMVSLEPQESQTFSAWAITSDFYAGGFFFFFKCPHSMQNDYKVRMTWIRRITNCLLKEFESQINSQHYDL